MADLSKVNIGAVSKTFSKLAEAAQLQKPRRVNRDEIFSEVRELQEKLEKNPEDAKEQFADFEIRLREAFLDDNHKESSAEDAAFIEKLKMRIDSLRDHYDSLLKDRERRIRQLEQRIEILSHKNQEREDAILLKERINELEMRLSSLKKQRKLSASQIETFEGRIEEAKKQLIAMHLSSDFGEKFDEVIKDGQSEAGDSEEENDSQEGDETTTDDSNDSTNLIDSDEPLIKEEETEDINSTFSQEKKSNSKSKFAGQQNQDEQVEAFGSSLDVDEAVAAANTINAQHGLTPTPDWLLNDNFQTEEQNEFQDSPPDQIKSPDVPSIEQREKTFSSLPSFNDEEINFPGDDDKKPSLTDKLKSMFKK